jgi:opacity protein-like surface antigen
MKNTIGFLTHVIIVAGIVCINQVLAVQPRTPTGYVSVDGGYGYSNLQIDNAAPNTKLTNQGPVWGANIGALFTPNVGIELGYLNGGNVTENINGNARQNLITNSYFYTLAVKGIMYDNEEGFSLFGKAGVAQGNLKTTTPTDSAVTKTIQKYSPYFAIGVAQNVNKHVAVAAIAHATVQQGANYNAANGTATSSMNTMPAFYAATLEVTYAF